MEYATMHWTAQWTLCDFGDWSVCDVHIDAMRDRLATRLVDGLPIVNLDPHYWDEQA